MTRSLPLLTHLGDACLPTGGQSSSDRQQYGSMSHAVAAQQEETINGDDDRLVGAGSS